MLRQGGVESCDAGDNGWIRDVGQGKEPMVIF